MEPKITNGNLASHVLIVIPSYNEIENLPRLTSRIFSKFKDIHLLVVDDNSPDGTSELVRNLQDIYSNLFLLTRNKKLGVGSAYVSGYLWGLERGYQLMGQMDADLSHRVRDLGAMIDFMQNNDSTDLLIGSRWIKGGGTENWPLRRIALSRIGNSYISYMLDLPARDSTAGFRLFRSEILEALNLKDVESKGFSFQIEMLEKIMALGGSVSEFPIIFREREYGHSKITAGIVFEALRLVTIRGIKCKSSRIKAIFRFRNASEHTN